MITYHRLPAAGGVGMTTVAYLAVSKGGRTEGNLIWWRPEAMPGLEEAHRDHPRRRCGDQRADRACRPGRQRPLDEGDGVRAGAILQPTVDALRQEGHSRRHQRHHRRARQRRPSRDRGRLRRGRNPLGAQLFREFVPQPADQPACRRVRRIAREPGQGGARHGDGGASRGGEGRHPDRRHGQADHGRRCAGRHLARGVAADREVAGGRPSAAIEAIIAEVFRRGLGLAPSSVSMLVLVLLMLSSRRRGPRGPSAIRARRRG